jgi:hypothetical protein
MNLDNHRLLDGSHDALQVSEGTSTGLIWIGNLLVGANPFTPT